ncbi:MAG TPA: SusC/RagA family TonB-linked outer membrane protein [Chitinophagaceae bacterium]
MKLSAQRLQYCLLAICFLGFGSTYAQHDVAYTRSKNRPGTFAANPEPKQTLFDGLKELNLKKGIYFLFSEPSLANTSVDVLKDMNGDIEDILDRWLKGTGIRYKKINEKTFVIASEKVKLSKTEIASIEGNRNYTSLEKLKPERYINITGRVSDAEGAALVGVSIQVKGTNKGTTTNASGEYSIDANKGDILVFSYIGFTEYQVTVGDDARINVTLSGGSQAIGEVVVTALGIRKESKRLGYSLTKVSGDALTKAREVNVANSLVGRVAGVNVSGVNGGPGSSSNIVIRGINSFSGGQPLYVINGVPMDNSTRGSAGMWGGADLGDGIGNINPDDIDEITILKGSTASALYGSRASNGVILITTKTGAGKKGIGVELNSNYVLDEIIDYTDFQYEYGQGLLGVKPTSQASAYQSGASSWGAKVDGTNTPQFDGVSRPYSAQPDNIKNFYRTGSTFTNTIAFSGGNDNGNFRLSVSNLLNQSVVPNSGIKRNTINLSVNGKITKRLIVAMVINYLIEKSNNRPNLSDSPGNSNFGITFLPTTLDQSVLKPGYHPDGSEINFGPNVYTTNPWFAAERFINDLSRNRMIATGSIRYNFTDWLFAQGRIGRDYFSDRNTSVTPSGTAYYPAGNMNEASNNLSELNADFLVGVNKKLGKNFDLNAGAGGNLMKRSFETVTSSGDQFSVPFLYVLNNAKNKNSSYGLFRKEIQSLYYNVELAYKNMLFLNTTGREDWFSTLPPDNNNLFYPSVSGSFIFTELIKMNWLNYGKLRAAWANTSGDTDPYQTQLYYGIGGSINGYPIGVINNSAVPNGNLQPYKLNEFELGLEARMFKNRLSVDLAWFKRKTIDEIIAIPASITSGYTGATINIGEMENKGIEILVSGSVLKSSDFSWNSSLNLTKLNNKVLKLADGQSKLALAESRTRTAYVQHVVGKPASQVMAFDYKRDASGSIMFDANGRPQQGELIPMGSGYNDFFGGWNNDFAYKNFNFGFLIDFKSGGVIYSATDAYATGFGLHKMTLVGREGGIIGDGVDPSGGRNTVNAKAWDYYGALSANVSSAFIYKADFIKLRQVVIGYNIPGTVFGKFPIQGMNISLVGRNLAILSKDTPNIDPESNYNNGVGQGLELAGVPPYRSYGVNLNIKF